MSRSRRLSPGRDSAQQTPNAVSGVDAGARSSRRRDASTAASVSAMSSPSNARWPDQHLVEHAPNAQTSLRLSAARPFACSGLM